VRLAYDDDLVTLGAVKAAARVVESLCGRGEAPYLETEVARLRGLRGR
jgi:hypothetical protein